MIDAGDTAAVGISAIVNVYGALHGQIFYHAALGNGAEQARVATADIQSGNRIAVPVKAALKGVEILRRHEDIVPNRSPVLVSQIDVIRQLAVDLIVAAVDPIPEGLQLVFVANYNRVALRGARSARQRCRVSPEGRRQGGENLLCLRQEGLLLRGQGVIGVLGGLGLGGPGGNLIPIGVFIGHPRRRFRRVGQGGHQPAHMLHGADRRGVLPAAGLTCRALLRRLGRQAAAVPVVDVGAGRAPRRRDMAAVWRVAGGPVSVRIRTALVAWGLHIAAIVVMDMAAGGRIGPQGAYGQQGQHHAQRQPQGRGPARGDTRRTDRPRPAQRGGLSYRRDALRRPLPRGMEYRAALGHDQGQPVRPVQPHQPPGQPGEHRPGLPQVLSRFPPQGGQLPAESPHTRRGPAGQTPCAPPKRRPGRQRRKQRRRKPVQPRVRLHHSCQPGVPLLKHNVPPVSRFHCRAGSPPG